MIYTSRYKDQPAVTLESDQLRAQFLPSLGGKLCSLLVKSQQFDLLVQRPGEHYRVQPYGGVYVDGECSGFDDMFPTIDTCHYERYPWQGIQLPDHGEVWSVPWAHSIDNDGGRDQLHMSTYGVRLPYRLDKAAYFSDESTLRIDYTLSNLSVFEFDFLWAAHPMLVLDEGAQLILPASVSKVVTVFDSNAGLGRYGDEFAWPLATLDDGHPRDLSRMSPKSVGRAAKYYVKGPLSEGWCKLTYPAHRLELTMAFPADKVPYLGVLPNEGGWTDLYNIFLEPATASFDRPDVARLRGECSHVAAGGTYSWYLTFSIRASA